MGPTEHHGVFASRSRVRRLLPAPPPAGTEAETPPQRRIRTRLPWAQLLRRVFFVDALRCPRCATPMTVLAFLSETAVVARILAHLGLPSEPPPLAPARGTEDTGYPDLWIEDAASVEDETVEAHEEEQPPPPDPWLDCDDRPP